jgi:hypothetical protein
MRAMIRVPIVFRNYQICLVGLIGRLRKLGRFSFFNPILRSIVVGMQWGVGRPMDYQIAPDRARFLPDVCCNAVICDTPKLIDAYWRSDYRYYVTQITEIISIPP